MIPAFLAGFAVGVLFMTVAIVVVVLHEDDVLDLVASPRDEWRSETTETEYEPQRDVVLDRILEDIRAIRDGDPRQTARDSATSARSKTFRA